MVERSKTPYRSANAGEFSRDASGRIDIKQYYSAGLAFKNIEPVPQSGFRQMGGTWRLGVWRRQLADAAIGDPYLAPGPHAAGSRIIWTGSVNAAVAAVLINGFSVSTGTALLTAEVQTSPGQWVAIGSSFLTAALTTTVRLAARPPGGALAAIGIRIRAVLSATATIAMAGVRAFTETGTAHRPRYVELNTDSGQRFMLRASAGIVDVWTAEGHMGAAFVEALTADMLPDLDFYAEGNTVLLLHGGLETVRLLLMRPDAPGDWRADLLPYDPAPRADLGGDYPMTDDGWDVTVRWQPSEPTFVAVSVTVDGETTEAVYHKNGLGNVIATNAWDAASWAVWAADIQAAMVDLPSLGPGVLVTTAPASSESGPLFIAFTGALSGRQFDVTVNVVNTAQASALAYHTHIGKTTLEPLFSAARGWPGTADLVQDRLMLARLPAVPGAIAASRSGEYFDFDTTAQTDDAARLDRLRSRTTETIVAVMEALYLLVFTDRGVYFGTNRTVTRTQPPNFMITSEIGAQPNCKPIDLEGAVYYVAVNPEGIKNAAAGGNQLVSAEYDDVSTRFNAVPQSLLASHLAQKMIRQARQKASTDLDASKAWLMRADGRLIAAQIIKNQEITGFCEWIAAHGGLVREIRVDGTNRLWLAVERAGVLTDELYDPGIFLHDAVRSTCDLTGKVGGLISHEGVQVWAVPAGFTYALGPYTVSGGQIDLQDYFAGTIVVGRWQPPRFESMPDVLVTPNDDVLIRPGRIHSAKINVIDTSSIAVGANGEAPQDVPLLDVDDQAEAPLPAKTKLLTVTGMTGFVEYPTLVITQLRPGTLRVKDFATGAKL